MKETRIITENGTKISEDLKAVKKREAIALLEESDGFQLMTLKDGRMDGAVSTSRLDILHFILCMEKTMKSMIRQFRETGGM